MTKSIFLKLKAIGLAACLTLACTAAFSACEPAQKEPDPLPNAPVEGYALVWRDEFDGSKLDTAKWGYQLGTHDVYNGFEVGAANWGNNEQQYYTEDSVSIRNGSLVITAQSREYEGKDYTSARILTRDLAYFTYGYFEARMQTPAINGMWPAFWMMPQPTEDSTANVYGGWAASGELDIMEARGREKNIVGTTLHFGGGWPQNKYLTNAYAMETTTEEWHTYGVDWKKESITWYVDGVEAFTLDNSQWYCLNAPDNPYAPYDQPFYIILNLAVGGNYDGGIKPPADFESTNMYVDYVRVFQSEEGQLNGV